MICYGNGANFLILGVLPAWIWIPPWLVVAAHQPRFARLVLIGCCSCEGNSHKIPHVDCICHSQLVISTQVGLLLSYLLGLWSLAYMPLYHRSTPGQWLTMAYPGSERWKMSCQSLESIAGPRPWEGQTGRSAPGSIVESALQPWPHRAQRSLDMHQHQSHCRRQRKCQASSLEDWVCFMHALIFLWLQYTSIASVTLISSLFKEQQQKPSSTMRNFARRDASGVLMTARALDLSSASCCERYSCTQNFDSFLYCACAVSTSCLERFFRFWKLCSGEWRLLRLWRW